MAFTDGLPPVFLRAAAECTAPLNRAPTPIDRERSSPRAAVLRALKLPPPRLPRHRRFVGYDIVMSYPTRQIKC